MAQPMYPVMGGGMGGMESPEVSSTKSLIHWGRIIALIFGILGVIWVLGSIAAAIVGSFFGYYAWYNVIYPVLFTLLNFLTFARLPDVEAMVQRGQYAAAKDTLLIWGILEIIGGLVVGILLLVAYSKIDSILNAQRMGGMGTPTWSAPPTAYPAASTPVASAPPAAGMPVASAPAWTPPAAAAPVAAPSPPLCPRCGSPATWIPQYGRWYCYRDAQYL